MALLQWLHVAKYPPSLAFMALELGLGLVLLALFFALDDGGERRLLAPLGLLGSTAFFYYLLHVHLLDVADYVFHIDHETHGLAKTYLVHRRPSGINACARGFHGAWVRPSRSG
jgi:uncharacterized membrane protein